MYSVFHKDANCATQVQVNSLQKKKVSALPDNDLEWQSNVIRIVVESENKSCDSTF